MAHNVPCRPWTKWSGTWRRRSRVWRTKRSKSWANIRTLWSDERSWSSISRTCRRRSTEIRAPRSVHSTLARFIFLRPFPCLGLHAPRSPILCFFNLYLFLLQCLFVYHQSTSVSVFLCFGVHPFPCSPVFLATWRNHLSLASLMFATCS